MSSEAEHETRASTSSPLILYSLDKRYRFATPTSAEDDQVSVLRSDPRTLRFLRFMPLTMPIPEVAARRESRLADPKIIDFNVFDDHAPAGGGGKLVGMITVCKFDEVKSRCEVGLMISPEETGKGLASVFLYTVLEYIFEERGMHRVTFETGEGNAPMRRWLEKVAEARLEATRVECWKDEQSGGWTDVKGYAIINWEWRNRVKPNLEKRLGIADQATEDGSKQCIDK
ncbi:acyl-CoA N-acyltransferase [Coprinopsis sp. MPI-PUGE-AT-0042]|nr:acyl-CoA N-acyltransferase [Coprinopsis sp. MPI-PUGE-AT-0042]